MIVSTTSLSGQMLVAMPSIEDPRFTHSVICMCSHNTEGALGLVLNNPIVGLEFGALVQQLNIKPGTAFPDLPIRQGGPVDMSRGFLLHSKDFAMEGSTLAVTDSLSMTATMGGLHAVAKGQGPERALLCLGYAGWGAGQLERELQENVWLTVDADPDLVFSEPDELWNKAVLAIGIDPRLLGSAGGQA